MAALSDAHAPLVLHNPFGQIGGRPMECLIRERPSYFVGDASTALSRYAGEVLINTGSPSNTIGWDSKKAMDDFEKLLWNRGVRVSTTIIFDEFWGATGTGLALNIEFAMACRARKWLIGYEGNMPQQYAGLVPWDTQLVMHSSLVKCVNNAEYRKGQAPLRANTIVWMDDAKGTVDQHVAAARQVMAKGVAPDPVIENGSVVAMDAYQNRAAEPESLSSAVSCGMNAEQVKATWPVGGGA